MNMMISVEDMKLLKAELKAEILKEITCQSALANNSTTGPMADVRNKYKAKLKQKYGVYHWDQIWTFIRRLACYSVGERYIRNLTPSKEANAARMAESIILLMLPEEVSNG